MNFDLCSGPIRNTFSREKIRSGCWRMEALGILGNIPLGTQVGPFGSGPVRLRVPDAAPLNGPVQTCRT